MEQIKKTFAEHVKELSVKAAHEKMGITFMCSRYFYAGTVTCVGDNFVEIDQAEFPWETGAFDSKEWGNVERFPFQRWVVMIDAIESFGLLKKPGKK